MFWVVGITAAAGGIVGGLALGICIAVRAYAETSQEVQDLRVEFDFLVRVVEGEARMLGNERVNRALARAHEVLGR